MVACVAGCAESPSANLYFGIFKSFPAFSTQAGVGGGNVQPRLSLTQLLRLCKGLLSESSWHTQSLKLRTASGNLRTTFARTGTSLSGA